MRQTPSTQRSPEGQSQLTEHALPLLGVDEGMQYPIPHTEPLGHVVLEVQGERHAPSTQSEPVAHCAALVHAGDGRGRHRPLAHVSVEAHCES
ncbi:hypothetical protein Q664_11450 [Archangium violaceum Cb vi76]|uniref:Uncharacterized protein n=1 Tax=Archangium violaceum Cb vi76 TaxID=1406225 RepID=A0A084SXB0_9BACT|nr:hypothetical protein Q664_11450 [Archangium violaceum Cb vi76]